MRTTVRILTLTVLNVFLAFKLTDAGYQPEDETFAGDGTEVDGEREEGLVAECHEQTQRQQSGVQKPIDNGEGEIVLVADFQHNIHADRLR